MPNRNWSGGGEGNTTSRGDKGDPVDNRTTRTPRTLAPENPGTPDSDEQEPLHVAAICGTVVVVIGLLGVAGAGVRRKVAGVRGKRPYSDVAHMLPAQLTQLAESSSIELAGLTELTEMGHAGTPGQYVEASLLALHKRARASLDGPAQARAGAGDLLGGFTAARGGQSLDYDVAPMVHRPGQGQGPGTAISATTMAWASQQHQQPPASNANRCADYTQMTAQRKGADYTQLTAQRKEYQMAPLPNYTVADTQFSVADAQFDVLPRSIATSQQRQQMQQQQQQQQQQQHTTQLMLPNGMVVSVPLGSKLAAPAVSMQQPAMQAQLAPSPGQYMVRMPGAQQGVMVQGMQGMPGMQGMQGMMLQQPQGSEQHQNQYVARHQFQQVQQVQLQGSAAPLQRNYSEHQLQILRQLQIQKLQMQMQLSAQASANGLAMNVSVDTSTGAVAAGIQGGHFLSAVPAQALATSKPTIFSAVPEHAWRECVASACKSAFSRLSPKSGADRHASVLLRMQRGKSTDAAAARGPMPCYLVGRDVPGANSPFQLKCAGSRIVAQKIIYASYQELSSENMGTWQVRQTCRHGDNTWWCFEPTHLARCARDHVSASLIKHPIPGPPDAVYLARYRKSRARMPEVKRVKEELPEVKRVKDEYSNHSSPAPSSPDSESTLSALPYDTHASIGTSALARIDPLSSSASFGPYGPAGHLTHDRYSVLPMWRQSSDGTATSCSEDEDMVKSSSPESEEIELPVSPPMQPFLHVSTIDGLIDSTIGNIDDINPMDLPSLAMTSV